MNKSARLYNCVLCRRQVKICSTCDRGNIYCDQDCSASVRSKSVREAGIRYQQTFQGRCKHAARQKRYRERQTEIVTHQGSQKKSDPSTCKSPVNSAERESSVVSNSGCCNFCSKQISDFLRNCFFKQ